jgi:hypothetical protein
VSGSAPGQGGWGVASTSGTGKAQRPFERVAEPTGGRNVAWQPSRFAGAVQRRRCFSRCTDRSVGGCADRPTVATARARATSAGYQGFTRGLAAWCAMGSARCSVLRERLCCQRASSHRTGGNAYHLGTSP